MAMIFISILCKDKVKQKYGFNDEDAAARINAFLTKIDSYRLLSSAPASSYPGSGSPDPLNLFRNPEPWDPDPDLTQGTEPVCKATHYYSTGYIVVTIKR